MMQNASLFRSRRGVVPAIFLGAAIGLPRSLPAEPADVTLVRDGRPASVIVLADKPTRSAQLAAAELQEHLHVMTGATVPIVNEGEREESTLVPVYVGESKATRMVGLTGGRFAPQESLVKVTADALFLIGRDDKLFGPIDYEGRGTWEGFSFFARVGTAYAVYDFLERDCGVRWYMPTDLGRVAPERATLTVSVQERRSRPWTRYRRIGYPRWPVPMDAGTFDVGGIRRYKKYCAPRDSTLYGLRTRFGGEAYGVNHSVYGYYERFGKEHPDWWVDGVPGKSKQLRYSNPEVVEQVAADAIDYFSKPFSERQHGIKGMAYGAGDYFGVVPLDNRDYGTACDPPLQLERRGPGFGAGTASNYIFTWVNRVAEKVAAVYPDVWLSTIGYAGMFIPPDFDMHPNVAVTVCMADGWDDDGFGMRTLRDWRARVSRLSTWEYHYSWGRFLWLRPREFADYFKRLQAMGVHGVFIEVGHPGPAVAHIDYTVTWKHLTDPDADVATILDEYYRLFYGPAEEPMRRFWSALQNTSAEVHSQKLSRTRSWVTAATDERLDEWQGHMDAAVATATADPYAARVAMVRDVVLHMVKEEAALQKEINAAPLPTLTVTRITAPPVLDGKLDDPVWPTVAKTGTFTGLRNEPLETETYARLAYDDANLYIAMSMGEPRMDEQTLVHVNPSSGVCTDDSIELNVDSTPETDDYIQVMLSANSVMWHWWRKKHKPGLTPDLGIRGKAWRGAQEWTCELVVPFEKMADRPPAAGDKWALNLGRNRCLPGLTRHKPDRYSVWAAPFTWSFHVKERFGTVQFGE